MVNEYIFYSFLFGICFGSFFNVVIYRIPKMMEMEADRDVAEFLGKENPHPEKYNLMTPGSKCGSCGKFLTWKSNIPVIGWFLRGGKCEHCAAKFSFRYPFVELLTGILWAVAVWKWGFTIQASAMIVFFSFLLILSFIDYDTRLLPDDLTLPIMWGGILYAVYGSQVTLVNSVLGAAIGYMCLWTIYWAFKLITGKEGMGYGDFKWLAGIGAWLGATSLIPVVLWSSILGTIVGVSLMIFQGREKGRMIPFGPFLSLGALGQIFYPINLF